MILAKLKDSSSESHILLEVQDKDHIFEMKEELIGDIRRMILTIDGIKETL